MKPSLQPEKPAIRTLEELMAAPTVDTPDTLLSEAGEARRADGRELARRLTAPLDELVDELLWDGGAS